MPTRRATIVRRRVVAATVAVAAAAVTAPIAAAAGSSPEPGTPNGLSVVALTFPIATANLSRVMVADARMPSPPALDVAETSRAPATHPIPV